jgi:hypothetical protein
VLHPGVELRRAGPHLPIINGTNSQADTGNMAWFMSLPYFLQFPRLLGQSLMQPGCLISEGIPSLHFSDSIKFC